MRIVALTAVLGLVLIPAFSSTAVHPAVPATQTPVIEVEITRQELEQTECRLLARTAALAGGMRQQRASIEEAKHKITSDLDLKTAGRANRMISLAYSTTLAPEDLERRLLAACVSGMSEFLLQANRSNESCEPVATFATFAYEKKEKKNPKAKVKRFLIRNLELSRHKDLINRMVDEVYASSLGKEETVESIRARCSASFFVAELPTGS